MRLGFTLACLLLLGIAGVALWGIRHAQEALDSARHSREVLREVRVTLSTMQDVETGVRGYLLTGDEAFLEPYREAVPKTAAELARLNELTAHDPLQQERARELQAAVEQMLGESGRLIAARRTGNVPPADIHQALDRGKQDMDQVRGIVSGMLREEESLNASRGQAYDREVRRTNRILTAVGVAMFILLVTSYILVEQHLRLRRRAEAALRETEARALLVADTITEVFWLAAADISRMEYISPGYERVWGRSCRSLYENPRSFLDSIHPDDRDQVLSDLEVQKSGKPFDHEYRILKPDGSVRWIWDRGFPARDDSSGAVTRYVGVARDITERKQAELALQEANAKLSHGIQELEARGREITQMSEMTSLLQTCMGPEEAYRVVEAVGRQMFPGASGALGVMNTSRDLVEVVAAWGEPALAAQAFPPAECWGLRSGRPYLVERSGSHVPCQHVRPGKATCTFCVPMTALGESLGMFFLSRDEAECGALAGADGARQNLVVAFAENVGMALANLKLRETLRMQSIRDPLTGLFNRRYMEEFLERELRRAARAHRPIGVILLDLDHFKQYNDSFGHEAGDVLLQELAGLLRAHVRGEDIVCRYGGEEFLFLLPDTALETSRQRAEDLRSALGQLRIHHRGQPLGTVTLSAGVAVFPEHGRTSAAVLRAADRALYHAKESGRNRVTLAETTDG